MKLRFLWIGVTLVLAGCAGELNSGYDATLNDPNAVAARVTVSQSQFDSGAMFLAPPLNETHFSSFPERRSVQLARIRDSKTGKVQNFVMAKFWYLGDWAFFRSVSYQGGETHSLESVDRQVGSCHNGCDFTESTILLLPDGFLERKSGTGFSLRYNTDRQGPVVVSIQAPYIQGFLSASAATAR